MLFYFDKNNQFRKVDFREWLDLTEASFDKTGLTDVPEWFFVCPFFSDEFLGPREGITPKRPDGRFAAVASLIGISGISGSVGIVGRFFRTHQVALQMPGKQLVEINKVSKTIYDNESSLSSYGFRTGRRLKAGYPRVKQEQNYESILTSLIGNMMSYLPKESKSYGTFIDKNSNHIDVHEIIRQLKDEHPYRLTRHGEFTPQHLSHERTRKDTQYPDSSHAKMHRLLRFQGQRKKHKDNHLKDVFDVEDFITRLRYILRNVKGIDKLDDPSGTLSYKNKFDEVVFDVIERQPNGAAFFSDIVSALRKNYGAVFTDKTARKYVMGMAQDGRLSTTFGERYCVVRTSDLTVVKDKLPTEAEGLKWIEENVYPSKKATVPGQKRDYVVAADIKLKIEDKNHSDVDEGIFQIIDNAGGDVHFSEIAPKIAERFPTHFNKKYASEYLRKLVRAGKLQETGSQYFVIRNQDGRVLHTAKDRAEAEQWLTDNKDSLDTKRKSENKKLNDYSIVPDLKVKILDRHKGRMMSIFEQLARQAVSDNFSGFKGEEEWIPKVQPIYDTSVSHGTYKDFYKKQQDILGHSQEILHPEDGISDELKKLQEPMTDDDKQKTGKANWNTVLHIPEGSILYMGTPSEYHLKPWAKKEWDEFNQKNPTSNIGDFYPYLVKKYKLWRLYEVHTGMSINSINTTFGSEARSSSIPVDHDKRDVWKMFSGLVERVVKEGKEPKVSQILKIIESKANIPQGRMRLYLERWMHIGLLRIDSEGKVVLDNPDFEEIHHVVLSALKEEEMNDVSLSSKIKMPLDEVQDALKYLESKGKIHQFPNGKWDLVLPPEEMNTLNDNEKKALELLKKGGNYWDNLSFAVALTHEGVSKPDAMYAIRTLKMKNKIFKSKWASRIMAYEEPGTLDPDSQKILDYLKDWPNSDSYSLQKEFGLDGNELNKLLSNLEMKQLIYSNDSDEDVHLNTNMVSPSATAKKVLPIEDKILNIVLTHWVTHKSELRGLFDPHMDHYTFVDFVDSMVTKGLLVKDVTTGRLLVKDASPQMTEEENHLSNYLKSPRDFEEINSELTDHFSTDYQTKTVKSLLDYLSGIKHTIKPSFDPVKNTSVYHDAEVTYTPDTSKLEDLIRKALDKHNYPEDDLLNILNNKYDAELGEEGFKFILDLMQKHGEIDKEKDFSGVEVWFKKDYQIPGPDHYKDMVMKILDEEGPTTGQDISKKLTENSGIHENAIDWLLEWMQGEHGGTAIIESKKHPLRGVNVYALVGYDWGKVEDIARNKIIEVLKEGPKVLGDLRNKSSFIGCSYYTVEPLIDKFAANPDSGIKKDKLFNVSVYYLDGQDPKELWESRVHDILVKLGGHGTLFDIARILSNSYNAMGKELYEFIVKLEKDGKLIRTAGEGLELNINDPSFSTNANTVVYTSTIARDRINAKVEALLPKFSEVVQNYVESYGEVSRYSLAGHLYNNYNSDFSNRVTALAFLNKLESLGQLIRTTPDSVTDDYSVKYKFAETPEMLAKHETKMKSLESVYTQVAMELLQNNVMNLSTLAEDIYYSTPNDNSGYADIGTRNQAKKFVLHLEKLGKIIRLADKAETDEYSILYALPDSDEAKQYLATNPGTPLTNPTGSGATPVTLSPPGSGVF